MALSDNLPDKTWKIPWRLVLIFFLLSVGILAFGYMYYANQASHFRSGIEAQLNAVANLKANQIVNWRQERMHDAMLIFDGPIFAGETKDWLDGKAAWQMDEILHRLQGLKQNLYAGIVLFDHHGAAKLSIPAIKPGLLPSLKTIALEAIHGEKVIFTDLYCLPECDEIYLSLAVPLHFQKGGARINVGAVVYQVNPQQFLYPLIQSWPVPSETAEIALVRRENNEVIFLNEMRHRQGTALTL